MNDFGPQLYLRKYNNLNYLIDGTAEKELKLFYRSDPPPGMVEFSGKMKEYNELRLSIFSFKNKVGTLILIIQIGSSRKNVYKLFSI